MKDPLLKSLKSLMDTGVSAASIASALGYSSSDTIAKWLKRGGKIPDYRKADVERLLKKKGVKIEQST